MVTGGNGEPSIMDLNKDNVGQREISPVVQVSQQGRLCQVALENLVVQGMSPRRLRRNGWDQAGQVDLEGREDQGNPRRERTPH